eukprot:Rhum_TRINITY_DN14357_c15_g1::Rhum_TRINITY_DN14357_c15_g1_i1::g.84156::m.84156
MELKKNLKVIGNQRPALDLLHPVRRRRAQRRRVEGRTGTRPPVGERRSLDAEGDALPATEADAVLVALHEHAVAPRPTPRLERLFVAAPRAAALRPAGPHGVCREHHGLPVAVRVLAGAPRLRAEAAEQLKVHGLHDDDVRPDVLAVPEEGGEREAVDARAEGELPVVHAVPHGEHAAQARAQPLVEQRLLAVESDDFWHEAEVARVEGLVAQQHVLRAAVPVGDLRHRLRLLRQVRRQLGRRRRRRLGRGVLFAAGGSCGGGGGGGVGVCVGAAGGGGVDAVAFDGSGAQEGKCRRMLVEALAPFFGLRRELRGEPRVHACMVTHKLGSKVEALSAGRIQRETVGQGKGAWIPEVLLDVLLRMLQRTNKEVCRRSQHGGTAVRRPRVQRHGRRRRRRRHGGLLLRRRQRRLPSRRRCPRAGAGAPHEQGGEAPTRLLRGSHDGGDRAGGGRGGRGGGRGACRTLLVRLLRLQLQLRGPGLLRKEVVQHRAERHQLRDVLLGRRRGGGGVVVGTGGGAGAVGCRGAAVEVAQRLDKGGLGGGAHGADEPERDLRAPPTLVEARRRHGEREEVLGGGEDVQVLVAEPEVVEGGGWVHVGPEEAAEAQPLLEVPAGVPVVEEVEGAGATPLERLHRNAGRRRLAVAAVEALDRHRQTLAEELRRLSVATGLLREQAAEPGSFLAVLSLVPTAPALHTQQQRFARVELSLAEQVLHAQQHGTLLVPGQPLARVRRRAASRRTAR